MAVSYVICAAGEGARFQEHFGALPKALIKLHGFYLLEWSLRSLPVFAKDQLIFITQGKHRLKEKLCRRIEEKYPFCQVVWLELDRLTRGQLETALLVREHVPPDNSVAVYNCDTYFESRSLVRLMDDPGVDGLIPCAEADGQCWSFCRVGPDDQVVEIKEKQRISSWATVGLYYFKDGGRFFQLAQAAIDLGRQSQGEFYVAPLYQRYIDDGCNVMIDRVSLFKPMGTPEQIEQYWRTTMPELKNANLAPVLVVDLDNTITIDDPGAAYSDKSPNTAIIEKMRQFSTAGWEIIIYTSRRMDTFGSDEARLIADVGEITLRWLNRHQVPFNGLRFGKPFARNGFYVDDKAVRPDEFLAMTP